MKNIFFLAILFFAGIVFIRADEVPDRDFIALLDKIKNPFMVDFPKPKPVIMPEPLVQRPQVPRGKMFKPLTVKHVVAPLKVVLPADLKLEGIIAGGDIYQAIINGQVVGLQGAIEGAQVVAITQDGVELLFKGRKFFLKID